MEEDVLKIPQLQEGYVSVLRADCKNGRILNNDSTYFDSYQNPAEKGGKIYYHIYQSYDEAKNYINEYLDKDNSVEFIIYDHNGKYIEEWELTCADKCIKILNICLQKRGKNKIGENEYFTLIPYWRRNKIRLFFVKTDCLEYEFVFTTHSVYIYIGDNRKFELTLTMKDIIKDNSILEQIFDLLFLCTIKVREYVQLSSIWIYFFDVNGYLLKKIRSKKYKFPLRYGRFLETEYEPIIKN